MPSAVPSASSAAQGAPAAPLAGPAAEAEQAAAQQQQQPSQADILRAFFSAQQRRRAHWGEYDDAFASLASASATSTPSSNARGVEGHAAHGEAPEAREGRCACAASSHSSTPLREQDLPRILALITAGLLDASHEVKTCATALRSLSPSSSAASPSSAPSSGWAQSTSSTSAQHCAALLDAVQAAENAVLRAIVARDSAKRDGVRDRSAEIAGYEEEVRRKREEITELCEEVAAELAELD